MNIKNSSNIANAAVNNSPTAKVSPHLSARISADVSADARRRLTSLAGSVADQVSLSSFSAALKAGDTNSPQQRARIAQLAAATAAGSYQIDVPAVSASIIHQHLRA